MRENDPAAEAANNPAGQPARTTEAGGEGGIHRLSAELVALAEKATACPAVLVQGEGEAKFLAETAERLAKYGDRIRLSEKQLAWLRKVAGRIDAAKRKVADSQAAAAAEDATESAKEGAK